MSRRLRREEYTIGWICALPVELAAAQEMLDEEHDNLERDLGNSDKNLYTLGSIGGHNIVIVCLPAGQIGNNTAAVVATQMRATFNGIQFGLIVGIGGGVPSAEVDIRLGDVVVSQPHQTFSGVVQYDIGKATPSGFKRTGSLNSPPYILLAAVARVRANEFRGRSKLAKHTSKLNHIPEFQRSKTGPDVLFEAAYDHAEGQTCELCSTDKHVARQGRESEEEVVVHYGTIASGNQVMRNAAQRDSVSAELGGVLCFEMEAAGLMNSFPCLVICGVCDYADSHKNKQWQAYAARTAAAWAKEVLSMIPAAEVMKTYLAEEVICGMNKRGSQSHASTLVKRRKIEFSGSLENSIVEQRAVTPPIYNQAPTQPLLSDEQLFLTDEAWLEFLDSLRFGQIDARQMTIRNAHARTCKWLLKNSKYLDWLDADRLNEHHGFLWIRGKPGTGKSTLMKFALINANNTMKKRTIISFFFNARGEDIEKSTIGTYRSLLLQLLELLPALRGSLGLKPSSLSAGYHGNIEWLKALLEQVAMRLKTSSVVCFIDALDECKEEQIRGMIQFFEHIGDLAVLNSIHFQVCFSSRHYPHITIRKGLGLVLEGQEGHAQDISDYLEIELKIGQSNIAQQIRSEFQEKASGIFMWVVLVVGILNKEYDGGRIYALQRRLQEIPSDLHELFRDILTRDSCNREELVLCIQWVLFSKQPLRPEELYLAVLSGVEPNAVSRWNPTETTMDVIKRFILSSSKGLAEITTSKPHNVQFIHESVRDFLLKDGLGNIWPDLGSNLQSQSHERLKQCCLNYMSMDVLALLEVPNSYPEALLQQAANLSKWAANRFPFLEYAVHNVLYHADAAEGGGITQAEFIRSFSLLHWVELHNLFMHHPFGQHKVHTYTKDVTLLYVLAEYNMSNLIRVHPSILSWFEVGKEHYGPPLVAALATGSKEAVRVFVQALAVYQSPGSQLYKLCSQYPKDKGIGRGLRHGFNFSTHTLLSYLAELGDEVVFALVLETGKVEIDSQDMGGRTPLSWAALNGHKAVVKLLLETGKVDVDSKDQGGQTPLWGAASNGYEAVVKLLLEMGKVGVDVRDHYGRTPLWGAASNGHKSVVKLLLETGKVNVDSKDQGGQTSLWVAASNGYEAVVKLLLEMGNVDVNVKDLYGRTLLSWAALNGHKVVVKLLLETDKVDVNSKNQGRQTPLWVAASNGHEAVVKLLLETENVDVDVRDPYRRTPLLLAALKGYEAVVKLLLETGKVDVNVRDPYRRTPLWLAALNGHEAVVKLLLETGKVDVNVRDLYGQTPLCGSALNGHEAVVKLLQ